MSSATVPLLDDDDTIEFGNENVRSSDILPHPFVTFFHLCFRCSAIVVYLFCGWFVNSFIPTFICIIFILSMDFWTVKNITGRIMVGLRWWNYVDDDGQSHWVFESRKGQNQNRINDKEATIFWLALVATPMVWSILFLVALFGFRFKWLLIAIIALSLNGANLYGYLKCKIGLTETVFTATSNFFKKQVMRNAMSIVTRQTNAPPSNASNSTNNV